MRVAGGANAPAQQLASQAVDVEIAADGQSVQGLSAQDDVQLDLPAANPGAPTRRIRSRSLDADGEPGVPGLRTARFAGDVEFREAAPAAKDQPAVERIVRAPALETKLQSGLGTIDRATFTEGVSVKDGTRTAQGPTMIYDVAQGTIALSSPAGATGFVQVSDERVNIEAGSLEWTLDGTRMVAQTNVKSVLKPGAGPAGSKAVKRPSMLTADQPINVTAATMTYNQQTGHAEYTGDAQLWQGATSIRAKTITLDEATGNLTAKDAVRSVMRIETKNTAKPDATTADTAGPSPAATARRLRLRPRRRRALRRRREPRARAPRLPRPRRPRPLTAQGSAAGKGKPSVLASDTIATANELVYDDAERRARYTGTARMVGERGDLRSERIELYFDESGRGVSRLEGFDNVRFSLKARPGGSPRWGNGGRLTYFADEERYVLSGPRAIVVERLDAQQCRETQGRTLTFFSSNDSAVVDSDNNSRTLTQTGTSCQEPATITPDMPVLRTHALTKSYSGRTVVRGVSLEVSAGEVVGLLGPNGAGKTTTFYMVVGLTSPDSGRVELDGADLTHDPMYLRARKGIAYLPQEPSIFRGLTVEDNILAILETLDIDRATRFRRLRDLLAELGLDAPGQVEGLHALGRRAAARRDHPRAGDRAAVHPARRALRRHRPDRRHRHPEDHLPPQGPRHRRPDHRSQRTGNPGDHRSRPHRPRRDDLPQRDPRGAGRRPGGEADLSWCRFQIGLGYRRRTARVVPFVHQGYGNPAAAAHQTRSEAHSDAIAAAGYQAAADVDDRAGGHAQPGSG